MLCVVYSSVIQKCYIYIAVQSCVDQSWSWLTWGHFWSQQHFCYRWLVNMAFFPSSTVTVGMQPWICTRVELLTRPFSHSHLLHLFHWGMGTKLEPNTIALLQQLHEKLTTRNLSLLLIDGSIGYCPWLRRKEEWERTQNSVNVPRQWLYQYYQSTYCLRSQYLSLLLLSIKTSTLSSLTLRQLQVYSYNTMDIVLCCYVCACMCSSYVVCSCNALLSQSVMTTFEP